MRTRVRLATGVALCALLAGCSSSSEGSTPGPNFATVTGAGKTVSPPDDLLRTKYPNPCVLLPTDSVEVLVGTQVSVTRNSIGCSWTPSVASLPSVSIAYVEIGDDAGAAYRRSLPKNSGASGLRDIGRLARIYGLDEQRTTRVDVLKSNVYVTVQVRTSVNSAQNVATARAIAIRVAQLVAEQIV